MKKAAKSPRLILSSVPWQDITEEGPTGEIVMWIRIFYNNDDASRLLKDQNILMVHGFLVTGTKMWMNHNWQNRHL